MFVKVSTTLALVFTAVIVINAVDATKRYVNIGCMYQTQGSLGPIGETFMYVCQMWEEHWLSQVHGIGGLDIFPKMYYVDVGVNVASGVNASNWLVSQGVVAVGAPAGPVVAQIGAVFEKHQIGFYVGTISDTSIFLCESPISPPCTKADGTRRLKWQLALGTPATEYMLSCLNGVAVKTPAGLEKSVSIITINRSTHTDVCVTGGVQIAQQNGFKINSINYIDYNATIENIPLENKEMAAVIQKIKGENPTVVLFCHKYANDRFPQLLFEANYMPPAVCSFEAASNVTEIIQAVGSNALFIQAPVQWNPDMLGFGYIVPKDRPYANMFPQTSTSLTSPQQFAVAFNSIPGAPALNALTAMSLAGFDVMSYGIWKCNCTTSAGIFAAASGVNMPTVAGQMVPDQIYGINFGKIIGTVQLIPTFKLSLTNTSKQSLFLSGVVQGFPNYALALTAPDGDSTSDMIFPAPTFEERIYVHDMYGQPIETFINVLVGISCSLFIAMAIFLWRHQTYSAVKSSSLPFSIMILFGAVIACISIVTWPVENDFDTCSSRVIVMALGFSIFFCPIVARSRRIAVIFNMQRLKVVKTTNWGVLAITLVLISIVLFPAIVWSSAYPLKTIIVVSDPLRPSLNYTDCSSENWIPAYITFFGVLIIILMAIYQAFKMRKIETKEFKHESKSIILAVCIFVTLILITGLAQLGFNAIATTLNQRRFLDLARGIYVLAITFSTIVLFWKQTYSVVFPSTTSQEITPTNYPSPTKGRTQSHSLNRSPSPAPGEPCERDILGGSESPRALQMNKLGGHSHPHSHSFAITVDGVATSFDVGETPEPTPSPSPNPDSTNMTRNFASIKEPSRNSRGSQELLVQDQVLVTQQESPAIALQEEPQVPQISITPQESQVSSTPTSISTTLQESQSEFA